MIGVGVALGQGSSQAAGLIAPPVETMITVAPDGRMPAVSPLHEGQSVQDMTDYAAMVSPANFSSSAGPIVGVDITFLGTATAADAPLAEGETAGLSLRVTDSSGASETFVTGLTTVEYLFRDVATETNELEINVNALADDVVSIPFTLSGFVEDNVHYNDDYTFTAGYLRETNPITGTQKINFDGLETDLDVGAVLRADEGLWVSDTGMLTVTHQFMRDGVAIAGATGPTYTLAAEDVGASITLEVRAEDGVNPTMIVTSEEIRLGGPALIPEFLASALNGSGDTSATFDFSGSGVQPGDTLYVGCLAQMGTDARQINGVRLDGGPLVPPRDETANDAATSTNLCACWCTLTAPASATMTIAMESSIPAARSALMVYRVPGAATVTDHAAVNDTAANTVAHTLDVDAGDVLLAVAMDRNGAPSTWAGVSDDANRGGDRFESASQTIAAADANYTISYTATTDSDSVLAVLKLSGS